MTVTTISLLIGSLGMLISWAIVSMRIRKSPTPVSQQVRLLRGFFLFMGLFGISVVSVPQYVLLTNPSQFPIQQGWAYIYGHIFFYISVMYITCLTFSMIPQLANKQKYAVIGVAIAGVIVTCLTIATMIYGTLPSYDAENNVVKLNAAVIIGACYGILALVSYLPASILFIINGFRAHERQARVRSFLLGTGLFLIIIAGPLHDLATNAQQYVFADLLYVILAVPLLTVGTVYRISERITEEKTRPITPPTMQPIQ
jgi:hypothetical protein